MSTNLVNKQTGELVTLANGTRMWIGTRTAHDLAVQQGTIGNNILVCITDDAPGEEAWQYSTSETRTGKTWIDGKPIYRKVYHESGLSVSTKTVESNMTYVDTVVSMSGQVVNKADGNIIPFGYSGGSDESIRFNSNNQSISFQGFTVTEYWVIFEYTKVSD